MAAGLLGIALISLAAGAANVPASPEGNALSAGEYTDCVPATAPLVFDGGYQVSMCYETPEGTVGEANAGIWASGQSGLLWFFDRDNAEVLVKVLNGCSHNGRRWVYVAPVTDVAFNLHVTSSGGRRWVHRNGLGVTAAARSDTSAFVCDADDAEAARANASGARGPSGAGAAETVGSVGGSRLSLAKGEHTECVPATTPLVFDGGYRVSLCYETAEGVVGEAKAGIWASNQSGLLWFFSRGNAEVLVKVLNGCSYNGRRWVYVAPVTDVAFNLHVTSSGGHQWTHRNRLGETAATRSDASAFDCATDDSRGPQATGAIPARTVMVGRTVAVDVDPYFSDPDGDALTYAAESSNPTVADVRVEGSVVSVAALAAGAAAITVTASDPGGSSARQGFDFKARDGATPTILSVEPPVLIEGDTATISGWGFASSAEQNEVFVDRLRATVRSASPTRLSVEVPRADCLPPREVRLRVSTAAGRHSVSIGSSPLSAEDRNWPEFEWRHTSSGDGCMHLPGSAEGGEFLIGVTSVSEDPSHLARVTLAGKPGDASVASSSYGSSARRQARGTDLGRAASLVLPSRLRPPALPSAVGDDLREMLERTKALHDVWRAGHEEAMARNQALIAELGQPDWSAGPSPATVARSSLSKGDRVTLKTGWNDDTLVDVEAVVRFVGDHMVWLDDVSNPAEPLSDAELMEQDAFYASHVKRVNDSYFGSLSDVDGNGRFLVLMTIEMNRRGISGEANPCHQYSRSQCHFSNEAEFMAVWAPDPDGLYGHPVSTERVLSFLPRYFTHEVTHLVQFSETLLAGLPRKRDWELEGGAEMAVELVGRRVLGHASVQDLGYPEWNAGHYWYESWLGGLFDFLSAARGAPEECSWLTYKGKDGNGGPCARSLNYTVGHLVHRFALDRWGGRYPGGERALLKRLTQSPLQGFASHVDVSPGWSVERILGEFYATLWLEGTAGRATPGMTSWDIHDIVSRFDESQWLRPHSSSSADPSVSARIRGGSSMYFHWTPDGPLPPTSFKAAPANDGPVFVWAIRVR